MEIKSFMTIPNFDGDRALISQLYDFNWARVQSARMQSSGGGISTGGNPFDNLHELSVVRIVDKNSIRLLQRFVLGSSGNGNLHFEEVEVSSEYYKNGHRSLKYVLTLSQVYFTGFTKQSASVNTPAVENIDLSFAKISVKQY